MSDAIVYLGWRDRDGSHTRRICRDKVTPIPTYSHVRDHSPTGLEWGYTGSGPAQLALAILCDATGDVTLGERYHQRYKRLVVCGLDRAAWVITSESVLLWIGRQEEMVAQQGGEKG